MVSPLSSLSPERDVAPFILARQRVPIQYSTGTPLNPTATAAQRLVAISSTVGDN